MASTPPDRDNTTLYDTIGGQETVRKIVTIFYDLMDTDPRFAELRALHAPDLTRTREGLEGYLTGWFGGPNTWSEQNPGRCIMSVHSGIKITKATAQQWVDAMTAALRQSGIETGVGVRLSLGMARVAGAMARDD